MKFDSVQIGAEDFDRTVSDYRTLLGQSGERDGDLHRFSFERGAVEIVPGAAGVRSLRFGPGEGDAPWPTEAAAYHGISVILERTREPNGQSGAATDAPHAIDHVVIQSPDLERALALWRDRLGVRLALDREFPQRGLRLLFFRSGGVTLEIAGTLAPTGGGGDDTLWGVAYQVADLEACRRRLLQDGVAVSEIRPGQKRGTSVATAKSHTGGVATLLIQPVGAG